MTCFCLVDRSVDLQIGPNIFQRAFNAASCFFNAVLNQAMAGPRNDGFRGLGNTPRREILFLRLSYQRGFNAAADP